MTAYLKMRPYHLIILVALIMLILIFAREDHMVDLHLHDTHIIVNARFVTWLMVGGLVLIRAIYTVANRMLFSRRLIWIHVIMTIGCLLFLVISLWHSVSKADVAEAPRRYYDPGATDSITPFFNLTNMTAVILVVLCLSQLVFLIHFFLGLYKHNQTAKLLN